MILNMDRSGGNSRPSCPSDVGGGTFLYRAGDCAACLVRTVASSGLFGNRGKTHGLADVAPSYERINEMLISPLISPLRVFSERRCRSFVAIHKFPHADAFSGERDAPTAVFNGPPESLCERGSVPRGTPDTAGEAPALPRGKRQRHAG